jgi:hypothetical protein
LANALRDFGTVRLPVIGGRRNNMPAGHPDFPAGDSPDMNNLLLYEGRLRLWPGRLAFTTAIVKSGLAGTTPAPIRGLWRFSLAAGGQFLVVSDGRDVWKFNSVGPTYDLLTPLYTTGTAAFTNGSPTVTGTATGWTATNCKPGMYIKRDADGVLHEVLSLVVATQTITLTANYSGAGGAAAAYTLRQRRSASAARWMRATVALDQIILVNGVDPALTWNGAAGTFSELGATVPIGRYITTFHQRNLLVMAGIASFPLRLQNSDAGDYDEWAADLAGSYDFEESTAPITGADGGHEYLFLFRENGVWRGFYEGFGVGINWTQVPGIDGPVYPQSVVRLGGEALMGGEAPVAKWAYFGLSNIFAFDSDRMTPIGEAVRRMVYEAIDPAYPDSVVGTTVPEWGLAIWSYPTIGSAGIPTHSLAYDYLRGLWFPRNLGLSALGSYDLTASDVQWDSLVGTIDEQQRIFDAVNVAPQPVCLCGDETGHVYYLAWGVNDYGTAIIGGRSSRVMALDERERFCEVGAVAFKTTAVAGARFSVQVLGGDRPDALTVLQQVRVEVNDSRECIAYLRCGARYLQVRITNQRQQVTTGGQGGSAEFGLYDLRVWAKPQE